MIYGNVFLPKRESSPSILEFGVASITYDEYCNLSMTLESCTDGVERSILEAQVSVLREVSFKDIIEKIKEAWRKFKEWIKSIWNRIFDKEKAQKKEKKKLMKILKNGLTRKMLI